MGNGGNDFIHTKMGNGSDMGSLTQQNPHGSDDDSSNPANETNDECSDASQELNNQVMVDGTLSSKSDSEEMVSASVSDKCISPSRTSHSALEMKNKVDAAPPVDKLNPPSKCQSISPNDTSVSDSEDIPNIKGLVQETSSSDPCSQENLDKKCHSLTAMNCDSSEPDIKPVVGSPKAGDTSPTKEVRMDDPLEAVSSRNLLKGNDRNIDVSSSALKLADKSLLQVGSDSKNEIGCENEKDGRAVKASGDSSDTVLF